MNKFYKINHTNKEITWPEATVKSRLTALGKLNGKKMAWIRSDLTVKKSNWLTRLIWTLVAKHFSWMRKHLYGVDLKKSRSLLIQIGNQAWDNPKIKNLYLNAVKKFNLAAPKHTVNPTVEIIHSCQEKSLNSLGFDSKEKVLAFVEKHGKELKSLNLKGIEGIDNADLEKFLGYCPNLNHLYIKQSKIDDQGLLLIKDKLPSLQSLGLMWCVNITDTGLKHLEALTSLKELSLGGCCQFKDSSLEHIKQLHSLQKLDLGGCKLITDKGLGHLKGLISLQDLSLFACCLITDKGLKHLEALTALKELSLGSCNKITDKGLKYLGHMNSLQTLVLWRCKQIKDSGLQHLIGRLTSLKTLNLGGCKLITDNGLKHLKQLNSLQALSLYECTQITDLGIKYFKQQNSLQKLDLGGCCQITNSALDELKKSLSNLEIYR